MYILWPQVVYLIRDNLICHPDQIRKGVCFHLSHNMPAMKLDGVFGNAQFKSNLFVQ